MQCMERTHPDIVGVAEIAVRTGATVNTVHSWRRRHPDFPAPLVTLAMGPVWLWADVEPWTQRTRHPGRPRRLTDRGGSR